MIGVRTPKGRNDSLLADMQLALLSEFGAEAMYEYLSRRRGDPELSDLLGRFREEEGEQIARLRSLMTQLGGRPPRRSLRRRLAAWCLDVASRVAGRRIALRLCLESEETVSRWYAQYSGYLAATGRPDLARTCGSLSVTKHRHALALQAWVAR